MTKTELLTIQRQQLDFLIHHCCKCSGLSESDQITLAKIKAVYLPKESLQPVCDASQEVTEEVTQVEFKWSVIQLRIVGSVGRYEKIIRAFTQSTTINSARLEVDQTTGKTLVAVGVKLAKLVNGSFTETQSQKALHCFQSLLLSSYCGYLKGKGVPVEHTDQIAKLIFPDSETKRKRLSVQAALINSTIAKIGKLKDWNIFRATELFFICKSLKSIL